MGYTVSKITIEEAYNRYESYEFALIYEISDLKLCKVTQLAGVKWDECIEARFFNRDSEMHIFDVEGEKRAVVVCETGENESIIKKYELGDKFKKMGNRVIVKEYLDSDEDGQTYVKLTRLIGIE